MKHTLRIGISGWSYAPWRKTFYPVGLVQKRELEFASRQVNSIEINGGFYALARPESYRAWFDATPEDFVFTVKAHRFITHIKKLRDVEEPIRNFFASGILALGPKLGPVLWQFPPAMKFDADRFERFLETLPHDFRSAAKLARRHGPRLNGRAFAPGPRSKNLRVRHAVEVRHPSFDDPRFFALLDDHGVALVTADSGGQYPYFERPAPDFAYVRLHGPAELYADGYSKAALGRWARKIKGWARTRDVFVFFDNDVKVHAPFDAVALAQKLIPGFAPTAPMNPDVVKDVHTPGPRMVPADARWSKAYRRRARRAAG